MNKVTLINWTGRLTFFVNVYFFGCISLQEKAVSTKKVFHRLKCDSFELIRSEEGLKCVIIESYSIFSFFLSFLIFVIFFSFDEKKVFFVHPFQQHLTCYGHLCMYKKTIYPLDSCDPLLHITSTLSTLSPIYLHLVVLHNSNTGSVS